MNIIAPCGIICDLCLGYQRKKNKCVGCNSAGFKPKHCDNCRIKTCNEKKAKDKIFCVFCSEFPCKSIKDLDNRYRLKYNESPIHNLEKLAKIGLKSFLTSEKEKWTCAKCGQLLCVHRNDCLNCGAINKYFVSHKNIN